MLRAKRRTAGTFSFDTLHEAFLHAGLIPLLIGVPIRMLVRWITFFVSVLPAVGGFPVATLAFHAYPAVKPISTGRNAFFSDSLFCMVILYKPHIPLSRYVTISFHSIYCTVVLAALLFQGMCLHGMCQDDLN